MSTVSRRRLRVLASLALGWLSVANVAGGAEPPPATTSSRVAETGDRDSPVARALRMRITLRRERHNLESVVELLSKKLDVPIEIIQHDRQGEGLTRGLALDLQADDKPAGQVLSGYLLALGHGKLTYVIKPKEQGGADMIFITTPAAIRDRREKWPPASIGVADALRRRITLRVPPEWNDFRGNMSLLAAELGVPIDMSAVEKQLGGREKMLPLERPSEARPVEQVLRELLEQRGPNGEFIYVVRPMFPGEPEMIFIATREESEKRGDPIPAELQRAPQAGNPSRNERTGR